MTEAHDPLDSPIVPLLMVLATIVLMIGIGTRAIDLHIDIGPWPIHHWFSWTGATFIAFFTPFFYVLKRRSKEARARLLPIHIIGGLLAVAVISVHFTQHVTGFTALGTGIVLYSAVALSAMTGLLVRYKVLSKGMREWRALHLGTAVTFYLAIVVHVMKGLRLI